MKFGNRANQHSFAKVPEVNIQRSRLDRSSTLKDTFDFDYLVPIYIDEILPGDTMTLKASTFARLATQIVPIMDNMYIDFFFFFCPNRLVWENWERFNGAQDDPGDSTDFVVPTIDFVDGPSGDITVNSIWDKFGLPLGIAPTSNINAMPARMYNLIYNDWFRDQNLQDSLPVPKGNGPDLNTTYNLVKRGKRHDYFTSCLPWPQKAPDVPIPMPDEIPIKGIGKETGAFPVANMTVIETADVTTYPYSQYIDGATSDTGFYVQGNSATGGQPLIYADTTLVNPGVQATINDFREAYLMQMLFELDARGGTRYIEILRNHFGVISPDFRLQRPEYLGGGQTTINVHPVAQTAPTSGSNPQAQLASYATATSSGSNIGFSKSFVEHGFVIGLACARADITYQQNTQRFWHRRTRFDYFWPSMQGLGEQAVMLSELIGNALPSVVFGYQERYAEYKYKPSEIHGQFRSNATNSLDVWHLAEDFALLPVLNEEFIEQNTPIERAIAVSTEPHLLFDAWFQVTHARPMKTYATPAGLGRF